MRCDRTCMSVHVCVPRLLHEYVLSTALDYVAAAVGGTD